MKNRAITKIATFIAITILFCSCATTSSKAPPIFLVKDSTKKIILEAQVSFPKEKWVFPKGSYSLYAKSSEGEYYKYDGGMIYRGDWLMKGQPWQGGMYLHFDKSLPPADRRESFKVESGMYAWVIGQEFTGVVPGGTYSVPGGQIIILEGIPLDLAKKIGAPVE